MAGAVKAPLRAVLRGVAGPFRAKGANYPLTYGLTVPGTP